MQEPAKNLTIFLNFFVFLKNYLHYIKKIGYLKNKNSQTQLRNLGSTQIKGLGPPPRVWCSLQHLPNNWWCTLPKYLLTTCAHKLNHVRKKKKKPKRQNGRKRKQELIDKMEQIVTHWFQRKEVECDDLIDHWHFLPISIKPPSILPISNRAIHLVL